MKLLSELPNDTLLCIRRSSSDDISVMEKQDFLASDVSLDDYCYFLTMIVFAFESNGKWGYANTSGEIIIEPKFDSAKSFSEGLAAVCKDEKWGFIDENGNVVIDYQFVDADYFNSERYCFVKTTPGTWQMIQLKVKF